MNLDAQWIVGFVDGEGCFFVNVGVKPQEKEYKYIKLQFQVKQHESSGHVLYALKSYFGCGHIYKKNSACWVYEVSKTKHLSEIIIPFFEAHKLKTRKRVNFEKFRYINLLIQRKQHLNIEGFHCIQQIKSTMNKYI